MEEDLIIRITKYDADCPHCGNHIDDINPMCPDFTDRYRKHDHSTFECPHCKEEFGVHEMTHDLVDNPPTIVEYYATFKI